MAVAGIVLDDDDLAALDRVAAPRTRSRSSA